MAEHRIFFMHQSDGELERLARDAFPFLFSELGAQIVESRYEPRIFGNGLVVIRAADVLVRLVRDRGDVTVDVGPADADLWDWFDLERVVQVLHGTSIGSPISDGTLNDLGRVLGENLPVVQAAFAPEEYPTTKARLKAALENAHQGLRNF